MRCESSETEGDRERAQEGSEKGIKRREGEGAVGEKHRGRDVGVKTRTKRTDRKRRRERRDKRQRKCVCVSEREGDGDPLGNWPIFQMNA